MYKPTKVGRYIYTWK